jgi:hypothetical protein
MKTGHHTDPAEAANKLMIILSCEVNRPHLDLQNYQESIDPAGEVYVTLSWMNDTLTRIP